MLMLSIIGLIVVGAVIGFGVFYLTQNVSFRKGKRK